jgi:hypothetical protein
MRYVIWHYRFDAARRDRRNVVVAASDNETGSSASWRLNAELKWRQAAGHADAAENMNGVVKQPGAHTRSASCAPLRVPAAAEHACASVTDKVSSRQSRHAASLQLGRSIPTRPVAR